MIATCWTLLMRQSTSRAAFSSAMPMAASALASMPRLTPSPPLAPLHASRRVKGCSPPLMEHFEARHLEGRQKHRPTRTEESTAREKTNPQYDESEKDGQHARISRWPLPFRLFLFRRLDLRRRGRGIGCRGL